MSILPQNSDYTSKDFDALKLRLEALIRSVFPTWTDHEVANFGNLLSEMYCFVGDVLCFNQDNNARESRIGTATQRRNLIALAKLVDYIPSLAEPATVDETFTGIGLVANVDIPAGTILRTKSADSIQFQLLSPVHLTPGSPTAVGTIENSMTQEQTHEGDGKADQKVTLDAYPFLSAVSVVGAFSGQWSQVENFLLSGSADKVFAVSVDNNDKATITFGNGTSGAVPSDVITITYKTGGGTVGNVEQASIEKIDGPILDVVSNLVTIEVTNLSAATGGVDRETLESIKVSAPRSIKNPTSSIARTDYEDNALSLVPGLTRALMLTRNEMSIIPYNAGRLYVVPTGNAEVPPAPGFPSAKLLQQVRAVFLSDTQGRAPRPAPATFALQTIGATYLDFALQVRVYLTRSAAATADTKLAVKNAAMEAIIAYFNPLLSNGTANPAINFGYYLRQARANPLSTYGQIPLSDLQDVIRDVPGILKLGSNDADFVITTNTEDPDLTITAIDSGVHRDIDLNDFWFPRFATLLLIDGDTNLALV